MDIVVRTPHGDADVSVGVHAPDATLGDLIGTVTGQAVPRLAVVDDRAVDCSTPLDDVGLMIGSTIVTDPPAPQPANEVVRLLQVAGPGAGRIRRLVPGRFRIGPGRRLTADQLEPGAVDAAKFEMTIDADGQVTVAPTSPAPSDEVLHADGTPVEAPLEWQDQVVIIGDRGFMIDHGSTSTRRRLAPPDAHGTVAYNRPPQRVSDRPRTPVVDAVQDATLARPTLWQRRRSDVGAFRATIGLRCDADLRPVGVELDLAEQRAIAFVGADDIRTALARTLLVDLATLHGPADLGVVIVARPDHVASWDWSKWLPHLRLDGRPRVLSEPADIAHWVGELDDPSRGSEDGRLTLVIVDDPHLWQQRDGPLRRLTPSPPADLRLVALCDEVGQAPAVCTTLVTASAEGVVEVTSTRDVADLGRIVPALVETGVAAEVARSMAPLVDTELDVPDAEHDDDGRNLTELIGLAGASADDVRSRWEHPAADTTVLGTRRGAPVELDTSLGSIRVDGADTDDVTRTVATIVLANCLRHDPDSLWVLDLLGPRVRPSLVDALAELPHAADPGLTETDLATIEPTRLLERLRNAVTAADGPERIVVAVRLDERSHELVSHLVAASEEHRGLQVVVAAGAESIGPACTVRIALEAADGRRHATMAIANGDASPRFLLDESLVGPGLDVVPFTLGRSLTPLERRLDHVTRRQRRERFADELRTLVALIGAAAGERAEHPTLLPPALPGLVDTDELLAGHPGDGIPIGLVDRPSGDIEPLWWRPQDGSLIAIGAARSGVDHVLSTIVLGLVDRFAADDVALAVVERSIGRRRILEQLPHARLVVAPDDSAAVTALIEVVTAAVGAPRTDPTLVVLIDDLGQFRERARADHLLESLDAALATATAAVGRVALVTVARSQTAVDALDSVGLRLVGGAGGADDTLETVGLPVGRCRTWPTGDLVQLATLRTSITEALAQRLTDRGDRS
jgi:hypothetical protein